MQELKKYYNTVESAISKIGLEPSKFRGEQEGDASYCLNQAC